MNRFRILISWLLRRDRRHHIEPVAVDRRMTDRRKRPTINQARERLLKSMGDFEQTIIEAKRPSKNDSQQVAHNDAQQVVIFSTLQETCRFRGSNALKVRLCRNERHQDAANTALAICEERKCPIIIEALRAPAAA